MPHHVWEGRLTTVPGLDLELRPVLAQEFGGVHDMGLTRGERNVQGVSAGMVRSTNADATPYTYTPDQRVLLLCEQREQLGREPPPTQREQRVGLRV